MCRHAFRHDDNWLEASPTSMFSFVRVTMIMVFLTAIETLSKTHMSFLPYPIHQVTKLWVQDREKQTYTHTPWERYRCQLHRKYEKWAHCAASFENDSVSVVDAALPFKALSQPLPVHKSSCRQVRVCRTLLSLSRRCSVLISWLSRLYHSQDQRPDCS